ncbi:MAG: LLM class flavin-dependent oxidoreductase [Acidimicrobiia bacterium]
MSLGFGLLSAQITPGDSRTWEDRYRETLELSTYLDKLGYSSVWTTEHHFVDDGYMPSLLVASAAMAAVTEQIEIGTGVVLAPLHDPLRLAEDAATVQAISNGRLTLGLGLGWSATEFEAFGADITRRGKAMTEMLQILPKAWSGDPFEWQGEVYSYPELAVRPVPSQPVPVVVGGGVDAAVRRAARYADGFFSNSSPTRLVEQIAVAKEEMERVGRDPESFRWVYYGVMYPGDINDILESVWLQIWKYSDMEASATRTGLASPPPLTDEMREKLTKRVIGGSPDRIVNTINELRETAGVPIDWVARSYFPDLPFEQQKELASELAIDVMPFLPAG